MRRWRQRRRSVQTAIAASLCLLGWPMALSAATCDEYDPRGPARATQITLNSSDFVDSAGDEMRSFIETGSIGRVYATVVSASPRGVVRAVLAEPQISRLSPNYGEQLKGIVLAVALQRSAPAAKVVVTLHQVCAQYFRNTFLYH